MIVFIFAFFGACWGAFLARKRKGNGKDMAQYGAAFGIAFAIVGLFLSIFLTRSA